jgi:DNA-directed RNA polymerase specialized sigma subunit, sigma24 homolog
MNSADPFETIVGEHYEPLFRFALSLTRMESDARDLTQQTFYVWATKGHQLRDIQGQDLAVHDVAPRFSRNAAQAVPVCPSSN